MSSQTLRSLEGFVRAVDAAKGKEAGGTAILGVDETARQSMRSSLQAGIRHQRRMAWLAVGLAVMMLGVALALVLSLRHSPTALAAIFAASGLSLSLPLWLLTRTLRELWSYELAAAVTPELDNAALADVLRVLLERLGAPLERAPGAPGAPG